MKRKQVDEKPFKDIRLRISDGVGHSNASRVHATGRKPGWSAVHDFASKPCVNERAE